MKSCTPLNAIVGFASMLVEEDDKKERQGYIEIMQENTELLLQLISDILDLSKIEAGTLDFNMGYLNIKDFCEDILRGYEIKEDKPVPVLLASNLPDYRIYTDKEAFDAGCHQTLSITPLSLRAKGKSLLSITLRRIPMR